MDLVKLLQNVKDGTTTIEEAEAQLKNLPYEDLDYVKIDHHRALRSGFPEVVYAPGKTNEQLVGICQRLYESGANVMASRANRGQYDAVSSALPSAQYNDPGRLITVKSHDIIQTGQVCVCTGGTSDIPVAEEAAGTAEFFGCRVERIYDVGVAGIHRLFDKLPVIRQADVIIAVAGMEGALAGVVAGLVDSPVIAVPTSVGYGANFGGLSALLTMLNACAEGIGVVNIDNGFGAGYLAAQINRLIGRKAAQIDRE